MVRRMVKNKDIDIWNNKSNDKIGSIPRERTTNKPPKKKSGCSSNMQKSTNV
jgi:hypothetical protein